MTTNNSVNSPLAGTTGSGNFVGSTSPTITTPALSTIKGSLGNTVLILDDNNASAVNFTALGNNVTGNSPSIQAQGSDTNIILSVLGKGTGGVEVEGTSTNDSANPSFVGEYITATGSTTTTSGAPKTVCSISLTAGDWDVRANLFFGNGGTTVYTEIVGGISTTNNTIPSAIPAENNISGMYTTSQSGITFNMPVGTCRISIAATTIVYLVANPNFTTATPTVAGFIGARRVR